VVAWGSAIRTAVKVAPVAFEVARQLDRQLRPHVLAYRAAREVDGYVGRWTDGDGTHWVVFTEPAAEPLRAFPPLSDEEAELASREFDRSTLMHHSQLPEAKAVGTAVRIRTSLPGAVTRRRPGGGSEEGTGRPELPG
jgi:hypothetical protein